jgi:hypothetical protein
MKVTPFMKASDRAHSHLYRGFELALDRHGNVPLSHNPVDARTMDSHRMLTNIAVQGNPSQLPMDSRKTFQAPLHPTRKPVKPGLEGQSEKTKKAGVVVDPTAHETFTGTDPVSVDTKSGYGLTPNWLGGGDHV